MKQYLIICVALFATVANAASQTPADNLEATFKKIRSMSADFTQTISGGEMGASKTMRGKLSFLRPRKFRWTISSPIKQEIIATGSKVWLYEPRLKQASVNKQPRSFGNTPASFLSGGIKTIIRSYIIASATNKGNTVFSLDAKRRSTKFQKIYLRFRGLKLVEMRFTDELGHNSRLVFSNIKVNQNLNASLFRFTPPKGVDVIDD